MRIYTEVVYTWDDNKGELVEESSKSFDYEGELTLCHTKREYGVKIPHNHAAADALGVGNSGDNSWQNTADDFGDFWGDVTSTIMTKAETAAQVAREKTSAAWTGMQNMTTDWWDKGAEGLTDLWKGTGMEDMAASWTDPTAMKAAWMPGKWDATSSFQSRWMMGLDMVKHMEGFNMSDFRDYKMTLFEDFDTFTQNAADAAAAAAEAAQDAVQDIVGDDPVGDIKDQGDKAEDSINETVATTMDTAQGNLEGILEDNNDTLIDMGNTFDYNVDQANAFLENTQNVVHDVSSIINQGFDATINPNNPKALFVNPTAWWKSNISGYGNLKNTYDNVRDTYANFDETVAEGIGSILGGQQELFGDVMGGVLTDMWPSDGGASDDIRNSMMRSRRYMTNAGDPFGNPSETRRLINKKRDFRDAPSMINAGV